MDNSHRVLVYGTLRRPDANNETVTIKGTLYDLGWFPGLKRGKTADTDVVCEILTNVSEDKLASFDSYEGYDPENIGNSFYIREWVDEHDAWVYVYNRKTDGYPVVTSGDWQDKKEKAVA